MVLEQIDQKAPRNEWPLATHRLTHGEAGSGYHTHNLPTSWMLQPPPLTLPGRQDLDIGKVKGNSGACRNSGNRRETT